MTLQKKTLKGNSKATPFRWINFMKQNTGYITNLIFKITRRNQKKVQDFMYYQHLVSIQTVNDVMHVSIDMGRLDFSVSVLDKNVMINNATREEARTITRTFNVIYPDFKIINNTTESH